MALNIKNVEVERLAGEVAALAGESKTEAVRISLNERLMRLKMNGGTSTRRERVMRFLDRVKAGFPNADFGRTMTKAEREEILGYGPEGY